MPCDVLMHPAQGPGYVSNQDAHFDMRQQAVVCRHKDEAAPGKHTRLDLHVRLVSRLPAATMNPEDDGEILRPIRRVDVEDLSLVGRIRVRDVGCQILPVRDGQER